MRPANMAAANTFFAEQSHRFEQAHPGVRVRVQFLPWLSAHDKLVTSLAGDLPPDVAELGNTWTPEFAAAGALAEVDGVLAQAGGERAFIPALVACARYDDGHLYGVPWYAGARALLYRKSYFAAARLPPPRTLDELAEDARRLTDRIHGRYGFAVMGNNAPAFYPLVWEYGGEFASREGSHWRSALTANSGARRALDFLDTLYRADVAPRGSIAWSDLDGRTAFAQGTVAMTITGSWSLPSMYASNPNLAADVGIVPFPSLAPGQPSRAFVGGSHLALFRKGLHAQLARAFVAQLLDDDAQRTWAQTVGFFPAKRGLLEQTTSANTTPVQRRVFAAALLEGRSTPPAPGWGAIEGEQTIPSMVQAVLSGQAPAQRAVERTSQEIDELLERGE